MLGSFGTDLCILVYSMGVGVYCINSSGSVIECQCFCQLFLLLNMTYLNQTRIRSLNAEALMISDIIGPNGQQ